MLDSPKTFAQYKGKEEGSHSFIYLGANEYIPNVRVLEINSE